MRHVRPPDAAFTGGPVMSNDARDSVARALVGLAALAALALLTASSARNWQPV